MQSVKTIVDTQVGDEEPCLKPFTVLIADDLPIVRQGLATLINGRPDMRVVAEAANGREAVEKFLAQSPDIALIEMRLPVMDGVETVIYPRKSAVCSPGYLHYLSGRGGHLSRPESGGLRICAQEYAATGTCGVYPCGGGRQEMDTPCRGGGPGEARGG